MTADILLLEDDEEYAGLVQAHFAVPGTYDLHLHHARDIEVSLAVCRESDVRVAIIDLSLEGGTAGTEAITAIWRFDKKIIFIIHSVSPPEAISEWSARLGVPYTSQFFLQKTGISATDVMRLHELTIKALRAYVPHLDPPLISVGEVVQAVSRFMEHNPSFRPSGVVSNIHHSQDVMNGVSQWAADRLARTGFDSTRIAVLMTGSFARLEASAASDADYFVVFDDTNELAGLEELAHLAYSAFMDVAAWFERSGVPVHDAEVEAKRPEHIQWHSTTLPTWFPLRSLLKAPLGRTTQLELTKQWFLLESRPIFNAPLTDIIRTTVGKSLGILTQKTVRDAVIHSELPESLQLLIEEFSYAYRHRDRDSLRTVKHHFMRLVNLFSLRLWLLRCFLDPKVFEAPAERLFIELSPLPVARLIEFREFLLRVPVLEGASLKDCLGRLDAILNSYGEAAHAFGSDELRQTTNGGGRRDRAFLNDLEDSAKACGDHLEAILKILRESSYVASYPELLTRKIV